MEFIYTIDPAADEPIMTLDEQIGKGEEGERYIDESQFCKELMFLDNAGKKVIHVWINSPGGSVIGGMQIFNTILKIKAKVDTHNVGMAASIAAPIFLAGRNRYMMDNAVLMVHPVSGGDEVSKRVFEEAVNTMISSRSYLTPEKIKGMMDATTWLDAHQCEAMGLCMKESSSDFNKQRAKPDLSNASYAHNSYKTLVNSAIENLKYKPMKNITNKLKLNEHANEVAVIEAIEAIENKATLAENKVTKMKTDLDEAENKLATMKADYDKLVAENKVAKDAAEAEKATALETNAKNFIAEGQKIGKIAKNADAKVIETWTNSYKANPEAAKMLMDSIPLNKQAPKFEKTVESSERELTMVVANAMHEVRNKLSI